MNYVTNLSQEDFEALCRNALRNHANGMCDPAHFTCALPPHFSDFELPDFAFVDRAGRKAAIWVCGYDSTPSSESAMVRVFVAVWICKYLPPEVASRSGDIGQLAADIADDLVAVLRDFDPLDEYSFFDSQWRNDILLTVITNAAQHPHEGQPSLFDRIGDNIGTRIRNVRYQVGTAATIPFQSDDKLVYAVDVTPEIIHWLREDPARIARLSAEQFELVVADRFCDMGFCIQRIGQSNRPDGGIDLVAWRPRSEFPFLLAIQAKHHASPSRKTPFSAVRDLRGVLSYVPADVGILVTNTTFTADAKWAAMQVPRLIRLRDIADLAKWLAGDYIQQEDLRNLPEGIEIAPGVRISIPNEPLVFERRETKG